MKLGVRPLMNCFPETHTIAGSGVNLTGNVPLQIFVPGNATDMPIFTDFTTNHNKTLLQLSTIGSSVPLQISIFLRGEPAIIDTIPAGATRIYQVEDFERLTVSGAGTLNGQLNVFIQKTFCICCGE
jgi:hypothetical protein